MDLSPSIHCLHLVSETYILALAIKIQMGRDSTVHVIDLLLAGWFGVETPVSTRFSAPIQTDPANCTMDTMFLPRVEQPGNSVDHPHPSSTKLAVTLYSSSGPSRYVMGRNCILCEKEQHLLHNKLNSWCQIAHQLLTCLLQPARMHANKMLSLCKYISGNVYWLVSYLEYFIPRKWAHGKNSIRNS
jgi:hypothetical protein